MILIISRRLIELKSSIIIKSKCVYSADKSTFIIYNKSMPCLKKMSEGLKAVLVLKPIIMNKIVMSRYIFFTFNEVGADIKLNPALPGLLGSVP